MIAKFKACKLQGEIEAPPSKSMAHRYLIGAALSKENCKISGIDYSEDILASIDCLRALGAEITINCPVFLFLIIFILLYSLNFYILDQHSLYLLL